jgi:hypothetical protein
MSQIAVSRPRRTAVTRPAPPLKVVAGRAGEASRGGFVVLCLLALVLGSLSILLLNTSRAKGAFELRDLQARSDTLTDTVESLQHAISAQAAPAALAERARRLGMVPNESAAFLRLSDGRILGVAKPAVADPTFSVVTDPSTKATTTTAKVIAPVTTVTKQGTVTTTTVVTTKAGGVIETVRTSVDSRTGRTTTTTTVTTPTPKPVAQKPATNQPKPGATKPAPTPTAKPTTTKPTTTKH